MIVVVTGTRRDLTPAQRRVVEAMLETLPPCTVYVGDCPTGVDALVRELRPKARVFRAAGGVHGRAMVEAARWQSTWPSVRVCLAFPWGESSGTRGCAGMARRAGLLTSVVELEMWAP